MNEIDKLFEGLPSEDKKEADIFDETKVPAKEEAKEESKEDEPRKNRRHRRLEAQLEAEREARIRAEERASALSEHSKHETAATLDERILKIYGNETPEAREAGKLLQETLVDFSSRAKKEALEEFEQRQEEISKQQKEFESFIDAELESIEEDYNVDVTSDAPVARKARKEFLEIVQKLSPKDENGTITGYADFTAAWEMYTETKDRASTKSKQKELADRSMEKSGSGSNTVEKAPTPGFRGWMRDYSN